MDIKLPSIPGLHPSTKSQTQRKIDFRSRLQEPCMVSWNKQSGPSFPQPKSFEPLISNNGMNKNCWGSL